MKKILSFLLMILLAVSPSFHIQEIHESKEVPYGLFVLMILTFGWMIFLYYKEHHE